MANQITINIGAAANDGTGDPLRTAFNDVNLNFANVWDTGLPASNVQFLDNKILTVNTNSNLVLAPNGIGKVASNVDIVPNTANVFALGGATRRWNIVYGQYLDLSHNATIGGNLTVTGNLSAGNISYTSNVFVGDLEGSVFDGASSIVLDVIDSAIYVDNYNYANGVPVNFGGNYSNANVAAYLPTYSGDISAGNAFVTNTVTASDVYSTRGTFSGDPVTGDASMYVGSPTFTNLGSDVMAQFTGNVPSYAQLNLQNYGNSTTASGDYIITADNGTDSTHFIDLGLTGSNWDGSQENSLGNRLGPNDGYLYVQDGDLVLGTSNGTIETWKFAQDGTLTVAGDVIPTANNTQSLGNATNQWSDLYVSNATIYMNNVPVSLGAGNVLTVNGEAVLSNDSNASITTTGNITANYFIGDGSQLTNLSFDPTIIVNGASQIDIPVANSNIYVGVAGQGSTEFTAEGINTLNLTSLANVNAVTATVSGNTTTNNLFVSNFAEIGNISIANGDITLVYGAASTTINISPDPEGQAFVQVPNDATANTANVRVVNNLGNVTVETTPNITWTFDPNGQLGLPDKGYLYTSDNDNAGLILFDTDSDNRAQLSAIGNVQLRADSANSGYEWTFDTNGELTVPGTIYLEYSGVVQGSIGTGPAGFSLVGEEDKGFAILLAPANSAPVTWGFGTDGDLTAPGNISGTNFIVSESLVASGASPAPTISGFGSANIIGNITGTNLITGNGANVVLGNASSYVKQSGSNASVNLQGSITLSPDTSASSNNGVVIGGNGYLLGPSQARNAVLNYGGGSGTMGIYTVNIYGNQATAITNGGSNGVGNIGANTTNRFGTAFLTAVDATGNITGGNLTTAGTVAVDTLTITNNRIDAITQFAISTSNTTSGNSSSILLDRNGSGIGISLEDTGGGPYSWNFGQDNILFPDGSRQYSAYGNANVVANLAALGSNPISTTGNVTAGNINANVAGYSIGYRDIPQISFTGNATIATTDAGKHYYSTESTDYILTIANNASQGFQVGTAISIVNQGTGNITIAQGSGVSLYLAGNATSGNRTLSTFGMATIMKVGTDTWFINGTGVS